MLGVAPKYDEIFKRSPKIAHLVQHGPVLPISYRLVGPGAKVTILYVSLLIGFSKEVLIIIGTTGQRNRGVRKFECKYFEGGFGCSTLRKQSPSVLTDAQIYLCVTQSI